jgi:hypothetical protein
MRASAPGIALRRHPAESSPVGSSDAPHPRGAPARGRIPAWLMAASLGVALCIVRATTGLPRRR